MLTEEFLRLSKEIGSDPLLVQGPGGNTSVKTDGLMWIKASGTVLADADTAEIFVSVNVAKALQELDGAGDGSCRAALTDKMSSLRPSIETTFHAMFPQKYVFHFHSVATICHAIARQGKRILANKMDGLNWVTAPYRKPGIPLSKAIRDAVGTGTVDIVVLDNHGIIVAGEHLDEVEALIRDVERRLELPVLYTSSPSGSGSACPDGWHHVPEVELLATDQLTRLRAIEGTYYPDHVVFLGPGLPMISSDDWNGAVAADQRFPAVIVDGDGVYIRADASPAHVAMLQCLKDVLSRLPADWELLPIGEAAEAELLNWDAEKYRQMRAEKTNRASKTGELPTDTR